MPTVTYDKQDLLNLVGRKLSDEKLEEIINSIKPNVEKITKNDIVVEHTADRPDLFGIEGLARAIKEYLGIKTKKFSIKKSNVKVKCSKIDYRPYIACAVVRNVKLNDYFIKSLMNIQEVLHETFGRKRKKVAIGIHDFDKIGHSIKYVGMKPETKIVPLGSRKEMSLKEVLEKNPKGKEYGHLVSSHKLWPIYIDSKGVFSFPPIINSDRTKVTDKTKNLFVELTGTDKKAVLQTLNIIVSNLAERNCKIETVQVSYDGKKEITPVVKEETMDVSLEDANKLLGISLNEKKIVELLGKMGYDAKAGKNKITVNVPFYRSDILHPVDIIEDIAIAYGYNNFEPELPKVATIGKAHETEKLSSRIRNLITGLGFQEISRYVLTNTEKQFEKMRNKKEDVIELENPVSKEYSCMRKYLLPGFMEFIFSNMHHDYPQKIFEIGDVVRLDSKSEVGARNERKLCCSISDTKVSYEDISSVLDSFMKTFGISYMLKAVDHPSFIEGRSAEILVNGKEVGIVGEINPHVLTNWKIEMPVAAFEISVDEF